MSRPRVALAAEQPGLQAAAAALARRLDLLLVSPDSSNPELLLVLTPERLELRESDAPDQGPVYSDFVTGSSAHRHRYGGGRGQPLARAVGLKKGRSPLVLDATAGLGRDAFVLASLGCQLTMLERSQVIAALLQDGLERALADDLTAPVARRMSLICVDAVDHLTGLDPSRRPDVIYLDPMYPQRRKRALVKKEMRVLRLLLGDEVENTELLSAARACAGQRVVVKRPAGAEWLGGAAPSMAIKSPNTRYDVYMT